MVRRIQWMGLRCAQAVVRRGDDRRRTCLVVDMFGDSSIKTLAFALALQIVEQARPALPSHQRFPRPSRKHTYIPGSFLAKPSTPTLPRCRPSRNSPWPWPSSAAPSSSTPSPSRRHRPSPTARKTPRQHYTPGRSTRGTGAPSAPGRTASTWR